MGSGLKDDLREALRAYDGRAPTILSEALARFRDHDGFLDRMDKDPAASVRARVRYLRKAAARAGAGAPN